MTCLLSLPASRTTTLCVLKTTTATAEEASPIILMGNTRPLGMASGNTAATSWCSHCGMGLAPAPGSGGSSVRCAFCHGTTRVVVVVDHHHRRGGHGGGVSESATPTPTTTRTLASEAASPPRPAPLVPAALLEIPASYPATRSASSGGGGGNKRALLVGVSYAGTAHELRGTMNDVREMRSLLRDRFGFPSGSILELTEKDQGDPARVPTRANLLRAMRWLVDGAGAGDSLVFHFSGHGVQRLDTNDDEVDGYNEALCPVDFEDPRGGRILVLDDEINEVMVRPLGKGVKLHAVVDTCHSGTILDLPYLCRVSRTGYWQWENLARPTAMRTKRTSGGLAISISGCSDDQKSADASGFSDDSSSSIGAMTDSFIKAVEAEPGTTYGRLLSAMRTRIRDGQGSRRLPGRLGSFVRWMTPSGTVQEPQLCSSEMFDIYKKPFLL